jgi:hypothetical protein
MMRLAGLVAWLAALSVALPAEDAKLDPPLAGLSVAAKAFARQAPSLTAQETLRQRTLKSTHKRKPHLDARPKTSQEAEYQTREIVSQYGWAAFKESPAALHEFRAGISVDGRPVRTAQEALTMLAGILTSTDDRAKRRLLDEHGNNTLPGAVTDFGQLILLFTPDRLSDYTFTGKAFGHVGAERVVSYAFARTQGFPDPLQGRRTVLAGFRGIVSLRLRDGVPLRISMESTTTEQKEAIHDTGEVEYVTTAQGVTVPVSVVFRRSMMGEVMVENRFQYGTFQKLTTVPGNKPATFVPDTTRPPSHR